MPGGVCIKQRRVSNMCVSDPDLKPIFHARYLLKSSIKSRAGVCCIQFDVITRMEVLDQVLCYKLPNNEG